MLVSQRRRTIAAFFALLGGAATLFNSACSSIYQPGQASGCQFDADCAEGQVCALDQGTGSCITESPPRRGALGFAIRSNVPPPFEESNPLIQDRRPPIELRYELQGCEIPGPAPFTAILQIDMRKDLRPMRLSHLTHHRLYSAFCNNSCEEAERCATQPPTCSAVRDGTLRLSTPSKLGLGDLRLVVDTQFQARPREQWEPSMAQIPFFWPCAGPPIQVEQQNQRLLLAAPKKTEDPPKTEATAPHQHWLWPQSCEEAASSWSKATTYGLAEIESCRFRLGLKIRPRDPDQLASTADNPPRLDLHLRPRYASQLALRRTLIRPNVERLEDEKSPMAMGSEVTCQSNFECQRSALGPDSVCGSDGYCGYSLERKAAGTLLGVQAQNHDLPAEGYCEIRENSQKSIEGEQKRSYFLELGPHLSRPKDDHWLHFGRVKLPLELKLQGEAGPELGLVASPRELQVCLPLWRVRARKTPIELQSRRGAPLHRAPSAELLPGIHCCNAQCLSSESGSKRARACELLEAIDLRSDWELDAATRKIWKSAACYLPPEKDGRQEAIRGDFRVQAKCADPSLAGKKGCWTWLWENSDDAPGRCRPFVASVERPANSIFASFRELIPKAMCKGDPASEKAQLPPHLRLDQALNLRPVIRGRVLPQPMDSGGAKGDKSPLRVVVMAERLREDGVDDPLGPFFFSQKVRAKGSKRGQFALPVEPGRYVLTALPLPGQRGGPTPFSVVDMRPGVATSDITTVDERGLMATALDHPATQLTLSKAISVRVRVQTLKDATDTRVVPYDLGSWKGAARDPKLPPIPELNDLRTCYPLDRGCRIRTLNPPTRDATGIPLGFGSVLRFSSRDGGPPCPGGG